MMLPTYDGLQCKRSLISSDLSHLSLSDSKRTKMESEEGLEGLFQSRPYQFTSQRNVPAFLRKLFNMTNDVNTDSLIHWSADGKSFLIDNHEAFAEAILPRFYKHNTFASFVRQLNMYDFHKIPHVRQGVLIGGDDTANEVWEFSHPHFQRTREDLLELVTRKKNRDRDEPGKEAVHLKNLLKEIMAVKKHQDGISADLDALRRANGIIWRETLAAREKHQKHQQVIKKLLQLLTLLFSPDRRLAVASPAKELALHQHPTSAIAIRQQLEHNLQSLATVDPIHLQDPFSAPIHYDHSLALYPFPPDTPSLYSHYPLFHRPTSSPTDP
ncbi:hypothetical protein BY458DRAFT_500896 [Sporodiniella umbellata]|nr:hypothetical protein BY458DRAFT_500896 [Sporodiniella umbellata]